MTDHPPGEPDDAETIGEDENDDAAFAELLAAVAQPPRAAGVAGRVALPSGLEHAAPALRLKLEDGSSSLPRAGSVLDDHYRIERELGRGGMGVVWSAENLRTGKLVAVKWIAPNGGLSPSQASAALSRLRREARAAASIRHENVVALHDVGGSDGAPYLVMELLEGESLRARVARGRLAWDDAIAIMLPVLAGVAAVHGAGVIHRDLKPDNLFLSRRPDGSVVPKVLDFGVAAMRTLSAEATHPLTRTGAILGTPAYMPLEQLTGRAVDARTDVYALGVVLYELLTQTLPYPARNASELAVMLATTTPTSPTRHAPQLRGERQAVLLRALARDPDHRFASVEEFARALRSARHRSPRRLVVGATITLGLSGLALGGWWWNCPQEQIAPAPLLTARSKPTFTATARVEQVGARPLEVTPEAAKQPSAPRRRARARPRVAPASSADDAGPSRDPTALRVDDF